MIINNISFKGTFKIDSADNSYEKIVETMEVFDDLDKKNGNIQSHALFPEKIGDSTKLTYVVPDSIDFKVRNYLAVLGINFKKFTNKELFSEECIKARMVVPQHNAQRGWQLVEIKTKEFNDLYKKEVGYAYVGDKINIEHPPRCESFKEYLKTGLDIEAPQINLREYDGVLKISFDDGRHRYAVLRDDLEFEKIPMALDSVSLALAQKYGLV